MSKTTYIKTIKDLIEFSRIYTNGEVTYGPWTESNLGPGKKYGRLVTITKRRGERIFSYNNIEYADNIYEIIKNA